MSRNCLTINARLLLMVLFACMACRREPATQRSAEATAVEQVIAVKPQRKTLVSSTTQPGRIEAFEQTPLYAKVAGYVDSVAVDIGDTVVKDQTLVKLAVPELLDDRQQKEALVAQAEAEIQQAASAIEATLAAAQTAQSRIVETEAGISRAQAEHDRWTSEYARIQELAAKGSVTKKLEEETLNQLRASEAAMKEAAAKVESSRAAYHEAQANIEKARADQKAAEARLQVTQADLHRAETMLAYTEIKAPFDGIVTRRAVDTGHYVQPAAAGDDSSLLVVARTDKVRIFVEVPEMEAPLVHAGDPARIRVQALPAQQFDAQVVRTSWSLLEVNHSLRAEVDADNPRGLLRPGMYATVTIQLEARPDVLTVPATAIVRSGETTCCWRVDAGKARKSPVELGLRSADEVEVVSGLEESSTVVLKPSDSLQDGREVTVAAPEK